MKYLIRLKPLGEFFFGSEQSFSRDDLRKDNQDSNGKASFFAKSFMFPQPHSIFGMLRAEILRKTGKMKLHINGEWVGLPKRKEKDSKEWLEVVRLVGSEAFDFSKKINSGIIKGISECFILNGDEAFYKAPNDNDLEPKKTDIEVSFNGRKRKFIDFGINPKKFENDKFISNKDTLSVSDIFEKVVSVGIKKNSEEEGFFQREAYKLKEGFEFGFFVELEEEINLEDIVKIGGDRSYFKLTQEIKELKMPEFEKKEGFERFVLTSDGYVDSEIEEYCDYIFGENEIFRGVRRGKEKTKRTRILRRGSVLYVNDMQKVEKLLKNHLYKFGYNKYKRS